MGPGPGRMGWMEPHAACPASSFGASSTVKSSVANHGGDLGASAGESSPVPRVLFELDEDVQNDVVGELREQGSGYRIIDAGLPLTRREQVAKLGARSLTKVIWAAATRTELAAMFDSPGMMTRTDHRISIFPLIYIWMKLLHFGEEGGFKLGGGGGRLDTEDSASSGSGGERRSILSAVLHYESWVIQVQQQQHELGIWIGLDLTLFGLWISYKAQKEHSLISGGSIFSTTRTHSTRTRIQNRNLRYQPREKVICWA
ncbi:hypothetical protein ACFX2J_022782 [Malus domestica]